MSITTNEDFYGTSDGAGLFTRLRRRKTLFAAVFCSVLALDAIVFFSLPRSYMATGSVMVVSEDAAIGGGTSSAVEQKLGDPADLESQILVLQSPRLLQAMLRQPDIASALQEDCEANRPTALFDRLRALVQPAESCAVELAGPGAVEWLRKSFLIGTAGHSRIVQVGYQSPSPPVAQTMVNALIDAYLSGGTADKQRSRAQAAAWVQSELWRLSNELRQSEASIVSFRREHGLVRGQTASIASERLSQLGAQLSVAEANAADAGAKLAEMRNGAADARQTLDSRTVTDLKQQLSTISAQVAQTAATYGSNYPALAALQQQRGDIQRRLNVETRRVGVSVQRDFDAASAQVKSLRAQLDALKQDVSGGDASETQIASMVRENDVKRELYIDLSKKANDLETQRRVMTADARLVSQAELPTKLFFPKLSPFAATGFVLATALAGAAALLRDRTDRTVRTAGTLEALSGVRVLGHIPDARRIGRENRDSGYQQVGRPSVLQEAIRSLYAQCLLLGNSRPRSLLVTSADPGDGKTFVTLAMAQFGAATGQRVLAIEADLRRPTFRQALGLPPGPGLTELLQGTAAFDEVVHRPEFGPDIVMAGAVTIASTELLSNGRIAPLLHWATDHYDLVLIDSPPAQVLMDAHVLARHVDGVLYCARWAHSSLDSAARGVRSLRRAGGNVLGVVVDMVQQREFSLYDARKLPTTPFLNAPG